MECGDREEWGDGQMVHVFQIQCIQHTHKFLSNERVKSYSINNANTAYSPENISLRWRPLYSDVTLSHLYGYGCE